MILSPVRRVSKEHTTAFTLVELLVAMSVLTLLILAVSQMVSGTSQITTGNRQHLDADGQARVVFDRLALDFSRMLKRQDVDYIFKDAATLPQAGNDRFFFYSEAPAYFTGGGTGTVAQSPLSLLGYRIDNAAAPTLSRLGKGLAWDEGNGASAPGAIVFLSPSSTPSASSTPAPDAASTLAGHWPNTLGTAPDYSGTDTAYHVISDQVCRLEICYLLKPVPAAGATAAQPAIYSLNPFRGGAAHNSINGMQDVRAIVVALAILDRTSRQIAPDLSKMTTALRDINAADLAASPPALMARIWQDEIDQNKLATDAQIPQKAASQLRIYQRLFYLETR